MSAKRILRKLENLGFTIKYSNGSKCKVIPPNPKQPFYSAHISEEKMLFPMSRFARKNWGIDILSL